nr:reverse transcriptase domain-containing protein [Tanacetum cinerariifolium]
RIRRSSKQKVENSNFEEHLPPIATMADNRTMAEMLRAPTEGCAEAIVVPPILVEQFKLKHSLINMMTLEQFFRLEKDNPHDHIRWGSPPVARKKTPAPSPLGMILYKDLLRACPHHGFTKLHQLDTFYNALNPPDQDSLNAAAGGNLLEKSPQDALTIIENKSKVRNSRSKPIASPCLASGGNTFPEFRDNIQGYVSAAASNYNQGNPSYRPQGVANQIRPPGFAQSNVQNNQNRFGQPQGFNRGTNFNQEQPYQATAQPNQNFHLNELEKIKRMNDVSIKAMQNQIDMMNTTSTSGSGSLPGNTVANPKGKLKAITNHSGLVTDGPTVPTLFKSVTPEEDERVEETYTDPDLADYTIKVPPPPVQKHKPPSQRNFVVHTRDSPLPNIPYPPRMLKQKQQEKDEVQIQKFWHMFKQLHLNITLAEALVLMPKYQKMLKALLSNKEKLQELANTPLNENCSAVILKKLLEKLGDPGKFLIRCGFGELKCKALADLGASINLMPLSVWKKLGLPDLIPTYMTLKLANRAICTPDGITKDVFILVGKFTFPADFVVVDYESDPRVPFILGIPFLRVARALIGVHGEEMILHNGDERLTLNMKHDTASYSNHPYRESVNLINIFNVSSEDCLEVSVSNPTSGNPTFSLHKEITSSEVTHEIHDSEGCNFLSEELPDIDSFNDIHPYFDDNPLSGSTTNSSNSLLEEITDELALITYPLNYDDNLPFDIESDLKEIEFLLYQGKDSSLKDSIDQTDLANLDDYFVDPTPEMFTDEHAPNYSSPPRFDVYDDDFLEVESDADNFYDDPFDSKGEKIKESKLLIDELDLPCDFLPYFEYDSLNSQDFSKDDDLPSPNNEDKVFNSGILIQEKSVTIITRVAQEKKLAISYASLVFDDFDPPFYEPLFFKDVPNSMMLLLFSSENEEKVFKPGIYTSEKFCGGKGIKREFSVPRTPQQNGIAESKNKTLIEAARTLLADSLLLIPFWTEAVNTACYVHNRVLVTKPHNKTPYELLHGRLPSIGFMRPFGCPVTILNTLDPLGKFQRKIDEGFLVRYSVCSKAFRVFNSRTRIIQETLHVNFMENKPNVAGSGPAWLFDIDSLTQTINYHPVLVENQTNSYAGFQDTKKQGRKELTHMCFFLCYLMSVSPDIHSSSSGDQTRKQGDKTENKDKGKSPVVTITGFRDLNAEFEECINNSSNGVNAASSSGSVAGKNYTNSTNDFSDAGPSNAAMPNLEDISHDADDVGAEADINNMESIISVSPIPTTRIHKDHPTSQIIGDLSLTTQTRSMARAVRDQDGISQMFNEDFHTCMFACFFSQEEPKRVYKALKDPSWIEAMQEKLLQFKMQKVWILVDLPSGKRAIGTKWVYRNKKDERCIVIRNKARLVAQGHTQEEGIDYEEPEPEDLPRDIPLDSVVVLRYKKGSKSENKIKVPTEMKLVLEQTQQGTSYKVSNIRVIPYGIHSGNPIGANIKQALRQAVFILINGEP